MTDSNSASFMQWARGSAAARHAVPGGPPKHPAAIGEHRPAAERPSSEIIVQTAHRLVRSNGCVMSLHNRQGRYLGHLAAAGIDTAVAAEIAAQAGDGSPVYKVAAPDWRVTFMRMRVPQTASAQACAGLSGAHVLQAGLGCGGGNVWLLSLVRNDPATPYTEADMEVLKTIVPMFEWLLSREAASPVLELGTAGWQILDQFRMGVVLLGSNGQLAAANRKALDLLRCRFGLMLSQGRLTLARPSDNLRFQQALRDCASSPSQPARMLAVESEDGTATLQMRVMRLGLIRSDEGGQPQVAVMMSDSTSFERPDPAPLRDIYGLTAIEARLVSLLCDGSSPAKAAEELGITANTARGYLKSVFRKMGVHRQTELIRLMAACPSRICE